MFFVLRHFISTHKELHPKNTHIHCFGTCTHPSEGKSLSSMLDDNKTFVSIISYINVDFKKLKLASI